MRGAIALAWGRGGVGWVRTRAGHAPAGKEEDRGRKAFSRTADARAPSSGGHRQSQ